ncbi:MAG TPA: hypothetical protein VFS62_00635, partial [Chloroflexota bacterium]|nr:hypothetical protein [Chloroflexota bacterium]
TSQHPVIWFLPYGDSPRQTQALDWLTANTYPAGSRWFGNAQVYGFASPSAAPELLPASASFSGQVQLVEAGVPSTIRAGDPVDVALRWQAIGRPRANYSVFVHLLDGTGTTVAQHDGWPAGGARPTSGWEPGAVVDDHHGLLTTTSLAPGRYQLETGLYDAAGGRLALDGGGGTSKVIGAVDVSATR